MAILVQLSLRKGNYAAIVDAGGDSQTGRVDCAEYLRVLTVLKSECYILTTAACRVADNVAFVIYSGEDGIPTCCETSVNDIAQICTDLTSGCRWVGGLPANPVWFSFDVNSGFIDFRFQR